MIPTEKLLFLAEFSCSHFSKDQNPVPGLKCSVSSVILVYSLLSSLPILSEARCQESDSHRVTADLFIYSCETELALNV